MVGLTYMQLKVNLNVTCLLTKAALELFRDVVNGSGKKQDWLWPQLGKKQGEYWENALSGQKWFLDQLWAFCLFDMFKNKADCFNEPAMFLDTREAFVGNFTKSTLVRLVDGRWQLLLRFLLLGFGLSSKLHLRDLQGCDYDKHWKNFKSKKLLYDVIRSARFGKC